MNEAIGQPTIRYAKPEITNTTPKMTVASGWLVITFNSHKIVAVINPQSIDTMKPCFKDFANGCIYTSIVAKLYL
jgi:hypothetical protein